MAKISELIKALQEFPLDWDVVIGSDEELNNVFDNFEVAELAGEKRAVVYGVENDGTEQEETN